MSELSETFSVFQQPPPEERALNNELILDIIAKYSNTKTLLRLRPVCKKWKDAFTRRLRKKKDLKCKPFQNKSQLMNFIKDAEHSDLLLKIRSFEIDCRTVHSQEFASMKFAITTLFGMFSENPITSLSLNDLTFMSYAWMFNVNKSVFEKLQHLKIGIRNFRYVEDKLKTAPVWDWKNLKTLEINIFPIIKSEKTVNERFFRRLLAAAPNIHTFSFSSRNSNMTNCLDVVVGFGSTLLPKLETLKLDYHTPYYLSQYSEMKLRLVAIFRKFPNLKISDSGLVNYEMKVSNDQYKIITIL